MTNFFMNISDYKKDFVDVVEFFKSDITALRTGRASTAIVENIMVEAYGTHQPLKGTASISVADAKTLNLLWLGEGYMFLEVIGVELYV